MAFHIHTHSRVKKSSQRVIVHKLPFFIGKISLSFILMIFIAVIGVIYMINFNGNATLGYQLTKLESERNGLKVVRDQKNLDLSQAQSLDFIRNSPRVRIMTPLEEVNYMELKTDIAYK